MFLLKIDTQNFEKTLTTKVKNQHCKSKISMNKEASLIAPGLFGSTNMLLEKEIKAVNNTSLLVEKIDAEGEN